MMRGNKQPEKKQRTFLPENIVLNEWTDILPFYLELEQADIDNVQELKNWLKKRSELDAFVGEDLAWRYIRFTTQTDNEGFKKHYRKFINEIQPNIAPKDDILNKKLISSPVIDLLNDDSYQIFFRQIKTEVELFREENIPLFTELSNLSNEYSQLSGSLTIDYDGKELTFQQAAVYLENNNRDVRKEVYDKMVERRLSVSEKLDHIFSEMVGLRHKVAQNAGFGNYRDYKFKAMGRWDYSIEDNLALHDSIRDEIVPLVRKFHQKRQHLLGIDSLKPYDLSVDVSGRPALKPFDHASELIDKMICVFDQVGNLGHYLKTMKNGGFLDLDSRKGKAPGGYNYPLDESGIPFIFMNASGLLRDVVTLAHEGGHAVHSFVTRPLELVYFKGTPSEVAELASMSMELISMDSWKEFFASKEDFVRAKLQHLEDILDVLPWIAIIDKFQHWIYTHPAHTVAERNNAWIQIHSEFSSGVIDFTGYEDARIKLWQKQGHIFDVPFYYIEYAIAQLGAIGIFRNYKLSPKETLNQYLDALKLGYTKHIPEIYKTAGISFDFSQKYIHLLAGFIESEINSLETAG